MLKEEAITTIPGFAHAGHQNEPVRQLNKERRMQTSVMPTRTIGQRVVHRLRSHSLISQFLGLILRFRFSRAGIIVREPGLPLIKVRNRGGYIEVANCTFYPGIRLECSRGARITIGNGTYLNRNVEIIAGQEVTIGRDCKIAWDVVIMDNDQHGIGDAPVVAEPVRIGDRVWIGCRSIVLKGVTIGDEAVIGAGTIVTRDVPPGAVVVGQPSRIVGRIGQ
jgi:acetyltransferase-like isoleucine patch superfamily enzyme